MQTASLKIGWGAADITPDQPIGLAGQFYARISEGVMDPVTATALALESMSAPGACALLISCDLAVIPDTLRDAVRAQVHRAVPELDPAAIMLNGTHTHSAPDLIYRDDSLRVGLGGPGWRFGLSAEELGVMSARAYSDFAAGRIAGAAIEAWRKRTPGGIAFGLGYAVVGRNRRLSYKNGEARMYGRGDVPEFSHVEGYEDPSVNVLATYDSGDNLTGLAVNLACPSQVSESNERITADFWHDTRVALRQRLGQDLFILPQCSAAGDQSPHILINRRAEAHRLLLLGRIDKLPDALNSNLGASEALRRELADRITAAVAPLLPGMKKTIQRAPQMAYRRDLVEIPRRRLTETDVRDALAEAAEYEKKYTALRRDLDDHPEKKQMPLWYRDITRTYGLMRWKKAVAQRYELQRKNPRVPVEIAVLRLGDIAVATNPFEFYLDYGIEIKARSPALLTFIVQLAGTGTYVPTARAMASAGYGAIPASNPVGPEGGREVVEHTLRTLNRFWE